MNNDYFKKFVTVLVVLSLLVATWVLLLKPNTNSSNNDESVATEDTSKPVALDSDIKLGYENYDFAHGNLGLEYVNTWNKVEGAENSDSSQIVTLESQMDAHEFYYCVDFNEYNSATASSIDFAASNVEVLKSEDHTSAGIGKPLKLVTYRLSSGMILTTVVDDLSVTTESTEFSQSITNPDGRMLQLFGRYNCRDMERPGLTLDEYESGQVYQEGYQAMLRLRY